MEITAASAWLQRVFKNVFGNAIEDNCSLLNIRVGLIEGADETGGTTASGFYLVDNGSGIPKDERDDFFGYRYTFPTEGG